MSIPSSLRFMKALTMPANAIVSTKASTKLAAWMSRPNMTASTSAVATTNPSSQMPSARPTADPIAAMMSVSR